VQPSIAENPVLASQKSRKRDNEEDAKHSSQAGVEAKKKRTRRLGVNSDKAQVIRRDIAKHDLSSELQLYYKKVIAAVEDGSVNKSAAENVFASLSIDPGLQFLVPYLTKYVSEQVQSNLENLSFLFSLMRLSKCLIVNPNLNNELYLHQLLPAVLTCVLSKKLCRKGFEDHWSLRVFAADLTKIVCAQYAESYTVLQRRIIKTFYDALNKKKQAMTSQYGAIVGLTVLGPLTIKSYLLPSMTKHVRVFRKASSAKNEEKRFEAHYCLSALLHAFGIYFKYTTERDIDNEERDLMLQVHEELGEKTVPWCPTEYIVDTFV